MNKYTQNLTNLLAECVQHMAQNGHQLSIPLVVDGKIHRYSKDAKRSKRDEWYVAYECAMNNSLHLLVLYGSWSDGSKYEFKSFDKHGTHDVQDRAEMYEILKKKKQETELQLKEIQNNAAQEATKLWQNASTLPPTQEHLRYIHAKGIEPIGIRFGTNPQGYPSLVIPLYNSAGQIRSLQFISMDGATSYKSFLSGAEKRGNFFILGTIVAGAHAYVVEGYATGVSVHMATNKPTVIAFDAGNIEPVVQNIRTTFPKITITIAADADAIGIQKAQYAAALFGCTVAVPEIPDKDFNDLHQLCGLAAVREQLEKAHSVHTPQEPQSSDPCADFTLSALPEPLQEYIRVLCTASDAHAIMVTCSLLATISGLLGTRVSISKGTYYQTLYPNLWLLCVAKSGQHKTTSLNNGAEIAFDAQAKIFEKIKSYEYLLKREKDLAQIQELRSEIVRLSLQNSVLPTRTSVEGLIHHLAQGHSGVIYASEFGAWLQSLAKTYNNDLKGILTDWYDVPATWRNLTKTQGDDILTKPYITICGVSTLAWLKENLEPHDVATGFFARFLIFAPALPETIPSGLPKPAHQDHQSAKNKFKQVLDTLLYEIGQARELTLSAQARLLFDNPEDNAGLHQKLYQFPKVYDEKCQEILSAYLKRWSPALLKLAMIMQLLEDPTSTEIQPKALHAALAILVPAMKSTAFLWSTELGESEMQRKCRILYEWICAKVKQKAGAPIKKQTIVTSKKFDGGVKEYEYILETLVSQGKLIYHPQQPKSKSLYSIAEQDVENIEKH